MNFQHKEDKTPIMLACEKGYIDLAKLLIDRGARIKTPGPEGRTALHMAAGNGHESMV